MPPHIKLIQYYNVVHENITCYNKTASPTTEQRGVNYNTPKVYLGAIKECMKIVQYDNVNLINELM